MACFWECTEPAFSEDVLSLLCAQDCGRDKRNGECLFARIFPSSRRGEADTCRPVQKQVLGGQGAEAMPSDVWNCLCRAGAPALPGQHLPLTQSFCEPHFLLNFSLSSRQHAWIRCPSSASPEHPDSGSQTSSHHVWNHLAGFLCPPPPGCELESKGGRLS